MSQKATMIFDERAIVLFTYSSRSERNLYSSFQFSLANWSDIKLVERELLWICLKSVGRTGSIRMDLRQRFTTIPLTNDVEKGKDAEGIDLGNVWNRGGGSRRNDRKSMCQCFGFVALFVCIFLVSRTTWRRVKDSGCSTPIPAARPLSTNDMSQIINAKAVISDLITENNDDTICVACQHGGACLRCIVWANQTVWVNPEIVSSEGEILGLEIPFLKSEKEGTMKQRAKKVVVKHDNGVETELIDEQAVCVQHAIDEFEGLNANPSPDEM
jgi:hypothetical protein